MRKKKVMVVDDSAFIRKIVSDVINSEADMETSAVASNGKIALHKISKDKPDVIILDVEMPEMNGLETLDELKRLKLDIPVIIFSAFSDEGARVTFEAFEKGARDFVTKPSPKQGPENTLETVKHRLIEKIRGLGENASIPSVRSGPIKKVTLAGRYEILAIGSSTGGPVALSKALCEMPTPFPFPILISQHMPPLFTKFLAERLQRESGIPAAEAIDGEKIIAGRIYIAPGDFHMTAFRKGSDVFIKLNQDPPEHGCRPAVDVMFRSLAQVYGERVIALILTGMGSDGKCGAEMLKKKDSLVLAQDENSSVVWGMPGAVVKAGLADRVLDLDQSRALILTLAAHNNVN